MRLAGLLAAALALALACRTPSRREVVFTPGAPAPVGPYSQAVRAGRALYLAGQIGLDPATGVLVPGGIRAEAARALDNLGAVLRAGGCSFDDVVQAQVFLADLADFAAFNEVYAGRFLAPPPARTTVQAAALPKGARVEIAFVAVRRD